MLALMGGPGAAASSDVSGAECTAAGEAAAAAETAEAEEGAGALEARRARLQSALCGGFGVQYWGEGYDADALAAAPHGLLILELTHSGTDTGTGEVRFDADEVARIGQDGARPVIGYLNVAEIEAYRDYHEGLETPHPEWDGGESPAGESLAAYWSDDWRDVLLERIDKLMATGIDGIFLDDVLHYYTQGSMTPEAAAPGRPEGHSDHAAAMMELIVALAERVRTHRCDGLVVINNAAFIGRDAGPDHADAFAAYLTAIDGVLVEDAMGEGRLPDTLAALSDDYLPEGVAILTVDVAGDEASSLAERSTELGFTPYVTADDGFNRLFPPALQCARTEAGRRAEMR